LAQLINTQYFYQDRKNGMDSDKVTFIIKQEDGTKELKIIEKPVIEYYITHPQYWDNQKRYYIDKEKVVPVKCYYKDLYKSITDTLNDEYLKNYWLESIQSGYNIGRRLQRIHYDYRLHGSDVNIQDYYIAQFLEKHPYEKNSFGLSKVVFDIEVDIENITGFPDPEEAEAPVNIITLVDMDGMRCYTLCLQYEHESYLDFINRREENIKKLEKRYEEVLKGRKMEFIIEEWSDELDMIKRFYDLINVDIKPDFVLAWNGNGFDNPYLMNRIYRLGETPENVMCPKDFPYKSVRYRRDTFNQDPADNNNEITVSSYSIYLDAMNVYANLRKGMGKEESYSLDYIGEKEVGLTKDENEEGFKTFHITDYTGFALYNIQDTIMMMMMEEKNNDVEALYSVAMMTQTRIEKAMKKTVCLRNLAAKFYKENGAMISNNKAQVLEKPEGKIKGAFVADPNLVDHIGMEILGNLSKFMFENCIDFDLSSLYPSIIMAFNIAPETCHGRVFITDDEGNDLSPEYIDGYSSRDYVNFAERWFNGPSMSELATEYKKQTEEVQTA
jgi:DNA polymerase elongation subunit (family B)